MRQSLVLVCLALACASAPEAPEAESPSSSGQSYVAALELFCNVDRLSGADPSDPLELERVREDYLVQHVENPDGIYLLTVFRTRDSAGKVELLECETRAHAITRCPLLAAM